MVTLNVVLFIVVTNLVTRLSLYIKNVNSAGALVFLLAINLLFYVLF